MRLQAANNKKDLQETQHARLGGGSFLLVANGGEGTSQLAGSALDNTHQLGHSFVVGRQGCQYVDLVSRDELAFERGGLDLELVLTLGEILEDTGGSARMLLGKRDQGRALEGVVENVERRAFNGRRSRVLRTTRT